MNFRVAYTDPDVLAPSGQMVRLLEACGAQIEARASVTPDELVQFCRGADAVICARRQITRDVVRAMSRCRIIARLGTGYDNIDVVAAGEAGIPVTNVPEFCTGEVADHTMALLLASLRKVAKLDGQVRDGNWNPNEVMPARRLAGMRLGLVGFGRIGHAVAVRAVAFGLSVGYFDPAIRDSAAVSARRHDTLDELLTESDIVSLHLPLTPATSGLIGARELRLMKSTAILINCARGRIVVERELLVALQDGCIEGAALDTLELEPPTADNPLFTLSNVILTPHCGAHSVEALADLQREAAQEVVRALRGLPLVNVVNRPSLKESSNRELRPVDST